MSRASCGCGTWRAQTGQPFEAEYRLRGVDGTYRWQLTRALPAARCNRRDHALVRIGGRCRRQKASRGGACGRPIAARTSSWRCWRTSFAIRSRPSVTPLPCRPGPATTSCLARDAGDHGTAGQAPRQAGGRPAGRVAIDDGSDYASPAARGCPRYRRRRHRDLSRDDRREGPQRHHAICQSMPCWLTAIASGSSRSSPTS